MPPNDAAGGALAGWSVYAQPEHSTNSSRLSFVSPSGIRLRSLKEVSKFLADTQSGPCIPVKGAIIEAEMEDPHESKMEWVQGTITKVLPRNAGFKVSFKVESAEEKGVWEETYLPSEEGTEWRWPQLSIEDFKQSAQQAVQACREAVKQMTEGKMTRAGVPVELETSDAGSFGTKDVYKILGVEIKHSHVVAAVESMKMSVDEDTPNDDFQELADMLGVTPSSTGMAQSRINYAIRRSVLRVLSRNDDEGETSVQVADEPQKSAASRDGAAAGGQAHAIDNTSEFHKRVFVGAMIEAEMDDTKGGTEWVIGQVQSVNATRTSFAAKFKVQSETEMAEWIDEYRWEELGREWRFSKVDVNRERENDVGSGKGSKGGSHKKSVSLKGVLGAEVVETHKSRGSVGVADSGASSAAEAEGKLRVGVTIEAEMDDSHGGTEWIPGTIQSIKKSSRTFVVKFCVQNDNETGEWTEEYTFDELGKEWRFPTANGHWQRDQNGIRQWVTAPTNSKLLADSGQGGATGEIQWRGMTIDLCHLQKLVKARGGFDECSAAKKWAEVSRELGFDCKVYTDIASQLKKLWKEVGLGQEANTKQQSHRSSGVQKTKRSSTGGESSTEDTMRQQEGQKLEELGIRSGAEVEVRIEWPPGKGKKKWIPTSVKRVSKMKGYFRTEIDADTEEDGGFMRFYAGEIDRVWRLPVARGSVGASKGPKVKQDAKDLGDPYVGAKIQVLFEVEGTQEWFGGKLIGKEKKAGFWKVLFDDGEEDMIEYPDPKGEVRIVSAKKKKTKADKEVPESTNAGSKSRGVSKVMHLRVGDFCRVLFDDGIMYLGVVKEQDADTGEVVIVFEDGEEDRLILPHKDVFEASLHDALVEWEGAHGTDSDSNVVPWWCCHAIAHSIEAGDLGIPIPKNWSRVLIRPPTKPKKRNSKSRKKVKDGLVGEQADGTHAVANVDVEMADAADGAEKKRAGKDGTHEESGTKETKTKRDRSRDNRKPRDRAAEKLHRSQREVQIRAQSQYLSELEVLLLQEIPEEVLEDEDQNDFIDATCIFVPSTDALNHRDFCLMCGSAPTKEEVLHCRDCGDCFHTYCAMDARTRKIPKEKRHLWRCPACRICEVCNGEENWDNMLCCDGCDRGFHTYCLKPPMKEVPKGGWKCNDCVQCVSCGLRHTGGTRKDIWRKDCTLCITCYEQWTKKAYCPVCKVVWQPSQKDAKAINCDTCNMWVHPACAGIDDAKYKEMQEEEEQREWNCPKCAGDIEASDEEEVDKKYVLPNGNRVLQDHQRFERFCRQQLRHLRRTCDAIEQTYQPTKPSVTETLMTNAAESDACQQISASAEKAKEPTAERVESAEIDAEDPLAEKFCLLKSFAVAHGHAHVRPDDGELDHFVRDLRSWHKQGKLTKERLGFLQVLGFCFDGYQASQMRALLDIQKGRAGNEQRDMVAQGESCRQTGNLDAHRAQGVTIPARLPDVQSEPASAAEKQVITTDGQSAECSLKQACPMGRKGSDVVPMQIESIDDDDMAALSTDADALDRLDAAGISAGYARDAVGRVVVEDGLARMAAPVVQAHSNSLILSAPKSPEKKIDEDKTKDEDEDDGEREIDVSEFHELAKTLTKRERTEKMKGLKRLKSDLLELSRAVDSHKYRELVPLFDDVIRTINDSEILYSGIAKEVERIRVEALSGMSDAAKRSAFTGKTIREPLILTSERHWEVQVAGVPATQITNSYIQKMLPYLDEFAPDDTSAAGYEAYKQRNLKDMPASRSVFVPRKRPMPKNHDNMRKLGYGTGPAGGIAGRKKLVLQGSELLHLMSQFYAKIKKLVQQDPSAHTKLCEHFFHSDWRTMTIDELTSFVESTFGQNQIILRCYYDVFHEHIGTADDDEEEAAVEPGKAQQEHAAWFCAEVRRIYGVSSTTYKGFINTMNSYAQKDKDTLGTIKAIKELFFDSPNLILEFANFVPATFKKYCQMDKGKRKAADLSPARGADSLLTSAEGSAMLGASGVDQMNSEASASMMPMSQLLKIQQQQAHNQLMAQNEKGQQDAMAQFQPLSPSNRDAKKMKFSDTTSLGASDGCSPSPLAGLQLPGTQTLTSMRQQLQHQLIQQQQQQQVQTQIEPQQLVQQHILQQLLIRDPNLAKMLQTQMNAVSAGMQQQQQQPSSGQELFGSVLTNLVPQNPLGASSASILAGASGAVTQQSLGLSNGVSAVNELSAAAVTYTQTLPGGAAAMSAAVQGLGAHLTSTPATDFSFGATSSQSLNFGAQGLMNGAMSGSTNQEGVLGIQQMDGNCDGLMRCEHGIPQLDGADGDADCSQDSDPARVQASLEDISGGGKMEVEDQGVVKQESGLDGSSSVAAASPVHGRVGDKRVIKPKTLSTDWESEPQVKRTAEARSGKTPAPHAYVLGSEGETLKKQQELKALIQRATEQPDETLEVVLSGRTYRQSDLLVAIKEKGMENGNIVWAHLAPLLGINTKSNHSYSVKLMKLLSGTANDPAGGSSNRPKPAKSKGVVKKSSGMVMPPANKKPKAPVFINRNFSGAAKEHESEKDVCSIRHAEEGSYFTLKLLTGISASNRENYVHFLPSNLTKLVPREDGLFARNPGVRKASAVSQRLWMQSIFESVKRSENLNERLRRMRMAKRANVEGWDLDRLGKLVEAASVGHGVLCRENQKLCQNRNMNEQQLAEIGNLTAKREDAIRMHLGQVHREINRDPRICCLCRIVGDSGVQGRLLYLEGSSWAHVNCLCWSKGVYEVSVQKPAGKIGMLCNVHDVASNARGRFCDFCGAPGATVECSKPGCCSVSHFGCCVLKEWSFYSEGRVFCPGCTESPEAEACGGLKDAWAPIHLYKLTSRHLRVMPRSKPKLLEAVVSRESDAGKGTSDKSKKRKTPEDQDSSAGKDSTSLRADGSGAAAASTSSLTEPSSQAAEIHAAMTAVADTEHSEARHAEDSVADSGGASSSAATTGDNTKSHWTAHTDKASGRTYYHNHSTKESSWFRPKELMTPPKPSAPAPASTDGDGSAARSLEVDATTSTKKIPGKSRAGSSVAEAGLSDKEPVSRLRAAIEQGRLDHVTFKRMKGLHFLLKECEKLRCVNIKHASAPEDNCLLGWASFVVTDEAAFAIKLRELTEADDGVWEIDAASKAQAPEKRAEAMMSQVLSKLEVLEYVIKHAGEEDADRGVPVRGWKYDRGVSEAEKSRTSADPPQAAALTKPVSKSELEKERAAEAAEAAQRKRLAEEALNREQWDAYQNNLLSQVAEGLQSGTVMARIGSLTVRRLGKIKADDDNYHTDQAIYPVGYLSERWCAAPGEIQLKNGVPSRRAVYRCQILRGASGSPPLFQVTVENEMFYGTTASEAWEAATRRKLRQRKKLKVHANEGQCDNVAEMFMACSYALDGDYMFGVTVGPVARVLEALKESRMLFNYNPRFSIWGRDYVRANLSGCARAEPFKRKKKMSTAKTLRSVEAPSSKEGPGEEPNMSNHRNLKKMYERLRAEPRTVVQRSPIHNLGLYCTRDVAQNDMVIEYVGELVRPVVGDIRDDIAIEKGKSTYMFRIDDDYIVDAMFKGNAARFMNHSCDPNCFCQVVTVEGVKHIIIFAKRALTKGEEISYDYKLPIEDVKVICHCGARNCRGYMN